MEDMAASLQHSVNDFINHLEDELGKVLYSLEDMWMHFDHDMTQMRTLTTIDCLSLKRNDTVWGT